MIPRKTAADSLVTRAKRAAKRLTSPELTYTQALDASHPGGLSGLAHVGYGQRRAQCPRW